MNNVLTDIAPNFPTSGTFGLFFGLNGRKPQKEQLRDIQRNTGYLNNFQLEPIESGFILGSLQTDHSSWYSTHYEANTTTIGIGKIHTFGRNGSVNKEGRFARIEIDYTKRNLQFYTDPFGQIQLFVARWGGILCVSNDLKLIRKFHPAPTLSVVALRQYLFLNYPILPNTYYNEIKTIRPGSAHTITFEGKESEKIIPFHYQPVDYLELLKENLTLIDDGAKSVFHLSGGLDSTLLCYLRSEKGADFATLTGYYESDDSDYVYSSKVARELHSQHLALQISTERYTDTIQTLIDLMSSPIMAVGVSTFYELAKQARSLGYTQSISGVGGDHIFTGFVKLPEWRENGLFELYCNVAPNEIQDFFDSKTFESIKNQVSFDVEQDCAHEQTDVYSIEANYRRNFVHEHMRMADRCYATFSSQCSSPFLHQSLINQGMMDLFKNGLISNKDYLRNYLKAYASPVVQRNTKEQMALSKDACLALISQDYLNLIEHRKPIISGLNYNQIRACLSVPHRLSKSQWRFIWITYNLHRWLMMENCFEINLSQ